MSNILDKYENVFQLFWRKCDLDVMISHYIYSHQTTPLVA
jgi:hypothetical protein